MTSRRVLSLCLAASLAAACHAPSTPAELPSAPAGPRPGASTAARTSVPAPSSPVSERSPTPLGPVRTRRLQIAQAALAPALVSWKLTSLGTDCTLLFSERDEWLAGCQMPGQPAGFTATGETYLAQPVLWNPSPLTLGATTTPYAQAGLSTVGTVATQKRESDGVQTPVLVLQDWDALHAHHPGFQSSGIEEWLGITVHEAFHAHQMWQPRVRALIDGWKDKGPATANELMAFGKANPDFRAAVDQEIDALRLATDAAPDARAARAALGRWLTQRQARKAAFEAKMEAALPGKRAWEMDGFYTFLEGTARYVEASFLMAPSPETRQALAEEPTFAGFTTTAGKKPTQLPGLSGGGSKYFYAVGMYLCFLLDRADPGWKGHLFDTDGLLLDEVERVARAR